MRCDPAKPTSLAYSYRSDIDGNMQPVNSITSTLLLWLVALSRVEADSLLTSGVTCSSTQLDFTGERCINATHYISFSGNCTNGVLLENVTQSSCSGKTDDFALYCHECGKDSVKNMVCANTQDTTEACADDCNDDTWAHVFVDYCSSESVWVASEGKCMYGRVEQDFATSGTCAETAPGMPKCLDCDTVGLCAEPSATCESLGLGAGASGALGAGTSSGNPIWGLNMFIGLLLFAPFAALF